MESQLKREEDFAPIEVSVAKGVSPVREARSSVVPNLQEVREASRRLPRPAVQGVAGTGLTTTRGGCPTLDATPATAIGVDNKHAQPSCSSLRSPARGPRTDKTQGTLTLILSGDIEKPGLTEISEPLTLRELVFDLGGGMQAGKQFKAVNMGGPSGTFVTDKDLQQDVATLNGQFTGNGPKTITIFSAQACMVDIVRSYTRMNYNISCGQCIMCRAGTYQMLQILDKILDGRGQLTDISLLEELAMSIQEGALCGLGKAFAHPVLSSLTHFRDEYVYHVHNHTCPAHVRSGFGQYTIDQAKCRGCSLCARRCPVEAITGQRKQPYCINQGLCIRCGNCFEACRLGAVKVGTR